MTDRKREMILRASIRTKQVSDVFFATFSTSMSVSNTSFFFIRLRLTNEERKQRGRRSRAVDEADDHVIIDESAGSKKTKT